MARQTHHTFLLRLWRVDGGGQQAWRASLEDAHSGERRGFGDLAALQAFLGALLEAHPPDAAPAAARPPLAEQERKL